MLLSDLLLSRSAKIRTCSDQNIVSLLLLVNICENFDRLKWLWLFFSFLCEGELKWRSLVWSLCGFSDMNIKSKCVQVGSVWLTGGWSCGLVLVCPSPPRRGEVFWDQPGEGGEFQVGYGSRSQAGWTTTQFYDHFLVFHGYSLVHLYVTSVISTAFADPQSHQTSFPNLRTQQKLFNHLTSALFQTTI